jgi:hypothetical protein
VKSTPRLIIDTYYAHKINVVKGLDSAYAVCNDRFVNTGGIMYLLFIVPSISLIVMAVMEMVSELRGGKSNL